MHRHRIFIGLTLILLLHVSTVDAQERAELPSYRDGDSWQFRVVEKSFGYQATADLDRVYEVLYSRGRVADHPEVPELRRMLGVETDRQYLQFPLVVGKQWSTNYYFGPDAMTAQSRVTGVEDVVTPAGTFRTFRIERRDTGRARAGGDAGRGESRFRLRLSFRFNYSLQTQSIVRYYFTRSGGFTREMELVEFRAAP